MREDERATVVPVELQTRNGVNNLQCYDGIASWQHAVLCLALQYWTSLVCLYYSVSERGFRRCLCAYVGKGVAPLPI